MNEWSAPAPDTKGSAPRRTPGELVVAVLLGVAFVLAGVSTVRAAQERDDARAATAAAASAAATASRLGEADTRTLLRDHELWVAYAAALAAADPAAAAYLRDETFTADLAQGVAWWEAGLVVQGGPASPFDAGSPYRPDNERAVFDATAVAEESLEAALDADRRSDRFSTAALVLLLALLAATLVALVHERRVRALSLVVAVVAVLAGASFLVTAQFG